jgi:hypothetical protein
MAPNYADILSPYSYGDICALVLDRQIMLCTLVDWLIVRNVLYIGQRPLVDDYTDRHAVTIGMDFMNLLEAHNSAPTIQVQQYQGLTAVPLMPRFVSGSFWSWKSPPPLPFSTKANRHMTAYLWFDAVGSPSSNFSWTVLILSLMNLSKAWYHFF